jgi:hypothetical protein
MAFNNQGSRALDGSNVAIDEIFILDISAFFILKIATS